MEECRCNGKLFYFVPVEITDQYVRVNPLNGKPTGRRFVNERRPCPKCVQGSEGMEAYDKACLDEYKATAERVKKHCRENPDPMGKMGCTKCEGTGSVVVQDNDGVRRYSCPECFQTTPTAVT